MLNSKQRANLKSIATTLTPILQIGYKEIGKNLIDQVDGALNTREIVKLSVLQTCDCSAREIAEELAIRTKSEVVYVIGKKIVLYRMSNKKGVKHIEF